MNSTPLEFRRWFQLVVVLLSFAIAFPCFWVLRSAVPQAEDGLQICLLVLFVGAFAGFDRLLTLFLPIVIFKLWPQIESPRPKA